MVSQKNVVEEMKEMKTRVIGKLEESRKQAEKEMAKVRQYVGSSIKQIEGYVKKNPEKAAMISAGIGAAFGAALALLTGNTKKTKKK